jgi:hypothetical protein
MMMLHRERKAGMVGELASVVAAVARSEALDSLAELNAQCLELLSDQAHAQPAQANLFLHHLGEMWRSLDAQARRRVAACPYLLIDAGFGDPAHWRWLDERHIKESPPPPYNIFFTVPRAPTVARQISMYAWHLIQSSNIAAQLLLGVPTQCARLIGACSLGQMHGLAERHPDWLRPRWPDRIKVWREFFLAAASGDTLALENAHMYGLQLLAGELRAAALRGA